MIWGLTLEPGKVYTEIVQDEVQLSMASLECRRDTTDNESNFSHIVMTTNNAEYLLCTLVNGATYQQNLDLKIMPQEKVAFSVQGASTVYLMGYSTVYPDIDQELDTGEDQSLPGWQEYSVDENQEDNMISVDNAYSPPPNAAPEQYAELTSSNTSSRDGKLSSSKLSLQESQRTSPKPSSREGGLVSSEDLLVEDWTVESQEDEPDYIVESVKAEQEDVEAVFPVADIDVKEEPSSPVASLSNPSSSETVMGTPGSLSNLELQSYQPGEESSHAVSSSWLVQIPEDTNSSSRCPSTNRNSPRH
ncbi:putative 46 kDa FK506-binding nuclear protein-like [Apostichopus japonicus]|uniref:Putative 46 kDa FK506-binding nuclear protein-like n=1 Tax=Stichopus japonicus TaxID=307972 RepID=A0A2G8K5H0_STIJA|nr:putative 46 kDa FK506-binding nuclear protein-like [Apostichopus japonicus]